MGHKMLTLITVFPCTTMAFCLSHVLQQAWMMKISFIQVLILEHTVYQQGCVCNSGRAEGVNIISASRQYLTQRWMTD